MEIPLHGCSYPVVSLSLPRQTASTSKRRPHALSHPVRCFLARFLKSLILAQRDVIFKFIHLLVEAAIGAKFLPSFSFLFISSFCIKNLIAILPPLAVLSHPLSICSTPFLVQVSPSSPCHTITLASNQASPPSPSTARLPLFLGIASPPAANNKASRSRPPVPPRSQRQKTK